MCVFFTFDVSFCASASSTSKRPCCFLRSREMQALWSQMCFVSVGYAYCAPPPGSTPCRRLVVRQLTAVMLVLRRRRQHCRVASTRARPDICARSRSTVPADAEGTRQTKREDHKTLLSSEVSMEKGNSAGRWNFCFVSFYFILCFPENYTIAWTDYRFPLK